MKRIKTTILFTLTVIFSYCQHNLSEIDTSLHYKDLFFIEDTLNIKPNYAIYDSASNSYNVFAKSDIDSAFISQYDSSKNKLLMHGNWKIDYLLNGRPHYTLAYYEYDLPIGKGYRFDSKNKLVSTFLRYPKIKGVVYNGYRKVNYKKGKIQSISYNKFDNEVDLSFYWYMLYFHENGNLSYYFFEDENNSISKNSTYNKKGELMHEYFRSPNEWYDKKWSRNRKKLKHVEYHVGSKTIKWYRNGKLKKVKTK